MVLDLAQVAQGRGKRVLLKSDYREIFIHSTGEYSQYKYLFTAPDVLQKISCTGDVVL